mmetsp:Transcript_53131/g.161411  ORF Transcript_53131/g.161411 Transcript_53131/m.161411 type:complete len:245 (-) Transcript_53131:697-1431(-)
MAYLQAPKRSLYTDHGRNERGRLGWILPDTGPATNGALGAAQRQCCHARGITSGPSLWRSGSVRRALPVGRNATSRRGLATRLAGDVSTLGFKETRICLACLRQRQRASENVAVIQCLQDAGGHDAVAAAIEVPRVRCLEHVDAVRYAEVDEGRVGFLLDAVLDFAIYCRDLGARLRHDAGARCFWAQGEHEHQGRRVNLVHRTNQPTYILHGDVYDCQRIELCRIETAVSRVLLLEVIDPMRQ